MDGMSATPAGGHAMGRPTEQVHVEVEHRLARVRPTLVTSRQLRSRALRVGEVRGRPCQVDEHAAVAILDVGDRDEVLLRDRRRMWVGAFGSRSRNATTRSVSWRMSAGISWRAILQKMQSVEITSFMLRGPTASRRGRRQPGYASCLRPRVGDDRPYVRCPPLPRRPRRGDLRALAVLVPQAGAAPRSRPPPRSRASCRPARPRLIDDGAAALATSTRPRPDRYLAYASAEPARLPAAYRGSVPWRGTLPLLDLQQRAEDGAVAATTARIAGLAPERAGTDSCGSHAVRCRRRRSRTHFLIRYDQAGLRALTIRKYAKTLEVSWRTEITDFGWPAPPFQHGAGGLFHVRIDHLGAPVVRVSSPRTALPPAQWGTTPHLLARPRRLRPLHGAEPGLSAGFPSPR